MKTLVFTFALLACVSGNTQAQIATSLAEMTNKIDSLNLSYQGLTEIPKEVFQYKNLKYLSLYRNQLTSLPKEIAELENLRELNLQNNPISDTEKEKIRKMLPNCEVNF